MTFSGGMGKGLLLPIPRSERKKGLSMLLFLCPIVSRATEQQHGSAAAALARGDVYVHRCAKCDPHTIDVLDVLYHVV